MECIKCHYVVHFKMNKNINTEYFSFSPRNTGLYHNMFKNMYDIWVSKRVGYRHAATAVLYKILEHLEADISVKTARLAIGYDAVCVFVASEVTGDVVSVLHKMGIRLILLRCAGFNNVDLERCAKCGITVMRVPGYSPEAVAEHAMALALAVNRKIHKAYIKVRENNFSLHGLTGSNFHGKVAGIIGTGKIGSAMCRICRGFGMEVIANDSYHDPALDFVSYVSLDELISRSDLISLHCPLTDETYHLINSETVSRMKNGVILVTTSRGALIKTNDLISGIRDRKFAGVGLDVYEEENENVFENREDDILKTSVTARLLSFPNVIVTSHQGFLTAEALSAISETTLENAVSFESGEPILCNTVAGEI